jgi:putative ABC transport system ATP-binding protein
VDNPLLQLQDLHKSFLDTPVLTGVSLELQPGDFLAITGPSGSGKTTLLGILGLLEPPSSGSYLLKGRCISDLNDMARSRLRH